MDVRCEDFRGLRAVRCEMSDPPSRESNAIDVTFNSLSKSVPQQLGHFSVKFVLKKMFETLQDENETFIEKFNKFERF